MKNCFYIILLLLVAEATLAQNKYVINGYVTDATNADPLLYASVLSLKTKQGVVSNGYGFYSMELPEGKHRISVNYMGYQTKVLEINLTKDTKLDIALQADTQILEEVIVSTEQKNENIKVLETAVNSMKATEIEKMPLFMGEKDPLKAIIFLPGVKQASGVTSNFFVRGGSADQNLVLIDEAQLYNPSHAMGLFSVFNSDVIKDLKLYKGEAPANYGGRLSSVLLVKTRDANMKQFKGKTTLGLLASKLNLEIPIIKEKSSLMIAGRRTYFDMFFPLVSNLKDTQLYFYDINAKYTHRISDNDRIYLSLYKGKDVLGVSQGGNNSGLEWGNTAATLSWNHILTSKIFLSTTLTYNNYHYDFKIIKQEINSIVEDFALKQNLEYYYSDKSKVDFGFEVTHHKYVPGDTGGIRSGTSSAQLIRYGLESSVYLSHEWKITDKITLNYGMRGSSFSVINYDKIKLYTFDKFGEITSEKMQDPGIIKTYYNLEPRFVANYMIDDWQSVKLGAALNTQYLNVLTLNDSGTPLDTYLPVTHLIEPQRAAQFSLGYFKNFDQNMYETSAEVYYKRMWDLTDYKEGADLFGNRELIESQLVKAEGYAYGLELYIKKKRGRLTGWASYTWSVAKKQSNLINEGKEYYAMQDKTHDINIVLMYNISKKWQLTAAWLYTTGTPTTYPKGKYYFNGVLTPVYGKRNEHRFPDYHRLDLGAKYTTTFFGLESNWNLSLYNAYGRKNPFRLDIQKSNDKKYSSETYFISLFRLLPSFSWEVKF